MPLDSTPPSPTEEPGTPPPVANPYEPPSQPEVILPPDPNEPPPDNVEG